MLLVDPDDTGEAEKADIWLVGVAVVVLGDSTENVEPTRPPISPKIDPVAKALDVWSAYFFTSAVAT